MQNLFSVWMCAMCMSVWQWNPILLGNIWRRFEFSLCKYLRILLLWHFICIFQISTCFYHYCNSLDKYPNIKISKYPTTSAIITIPLTNFDPYFTLKIVKKSFEILKNRFCEYMFCCPTWSKFSVNWNGPTLRFLTSIRP